MRDKPEISLILPAWNCESFIADSIREAHTYLSGIGAPFDIVVVDDGSTDGTGAAVPRLEHVSVLRLDRNLGKGGAVRAGMLAVRGDVRVFTDADLPYGCRPIADAAGYITTRGFHLAIGDRTFPASYYEPPGFPRRWLSAAASLLFRTLITGGIYDTQCGFKAFRGDVADELFKVSRISGFAFDVEILYVALKHRLDIKRMPVRLRTNKQNSVRPFLDAGAAVRDILQVRALAMSGHYRSESLEAILAADQAAGASGFEGRDARD